MPDFEVYYEWGSYCGYSKVYAINTHSDCFLVVNKFGDFMWISTSSCKLKWTHFENQTKIEQIIKKEENKNDVEF